MALSLVPAFLMGGVHNYSQLLAYGFLIGIGLASFSVGVGFVSGWYSAERQGFALGVYGAGRPRINSSVPTITASSTWMMEIRWLARPLAGCRG